MDATTSPFAASDEGANLRLAPCKEPTIAELLTDPLTLALMKADHVDLQALEQMLDSVTERFSIAGRVATQPSVVLRRSARAQSESPIPDYLRWTSINRFSDSAAPRSLHGAIAAKASETACGSNCSW
jgi:hypothetical protein